MAPRPSLLSIHLTIWLLLATCAHEALAIPYPRDDLHAAGYGYLMPRQCNEYCGYNNMYCCEAGSACYTSNGIAGCSAAAGGGYAWYTTTWTLTQTFTKTYNSFIPAATAPAGGGNCVPPEGSGQIACGKICCANWQYCAYEGQCMANIPGPIVPTSSLPTAAATGAQTLTTPFSAPYRVTSGTVTVSPTGTAAAGAATTSGGVSAGGSTAGGLSGGAIAGIVIGTIAGIGLLLLICACCVVRGLWHGLLAIFGLGKKKSEKDEDYRRNSTHSHRDNHGSWFGGRPSTVAGRKEKSSGMGLLGIGAALGTLALLLGLKRDKKKKSTGSRARSNVSSSYWSDSYTATSPSKHPFVTDSLPATGFTNMDSTGSRSSDRRTRRSAARHSRTGSRVTRTTHTHTRVSRAPSARSARSPRD